ncbi:hypothetical protein M405DRAFT_838807 [Rhizopogon salebrosus TDB-379]|nr:hypothetical protein M405DRAFT_838807 [Rhizopogon salebrosus TDB-379]
MDETRIPKGICAPNDTWYALATVQDRDTSGSWQVKINLATSVWPAGHPMGRNSDLADYSIPALDYLQKRIIVPDEIRQSQIAVQRCCSATWLKQAASRRERVPPSGTYCATTEDSFERKDMAVSTHIDWSPPRPQAATPGGSAGRQSFRRYGNLSFASTQPIPTLFNGIVSPSADGNAAPLTFFRLSVISIFVAHMAQKGFGKDNAAKLTSNAGTETSVASRAK